MTILYAFLVLAGMGLIFGLILALAARVFKVEEDDRLEPLTELLPGANCGGCGYAGCAALAGAILKGEAEPSACPVADDTAQEQMAGLLGLQIKPNTRMTALVRCSGGVRCAKKFQYSGIADCVAAQRIGGGGHNECTYGCIGLGTCVRACPFGAISMVDGVAVVDHERCTGCMKCANACPKRIITPVPYYADVNIACSSLDRAANLRRICEIGCLGCRICEKICQHDAVHIKDNLATIDHEKCTGCGDCAEKCPRKLIIDAKLDKGPRVLEQAQ